MSLQTDTRRVVPRAGGTIGGLVGRLIGLVRARQIHARQRREAAGLTERDLADIGVSRAELAAEMAKPFWRR
ncbi:MAG: DUF1127 domain-containing protein [Proteobacteria bacterium]|nr:DUF1127 domain-containing protein [Pseudomonadota bacterium]